MVGTSSHPTAGSPTTQCSITQVGKLAIDHLGVEVGHWLDYHHHIPEQLPPLPSLGPPLLNTRGLNRSHLQSILLHILHVQPLVFILHFKINNFIRSSVLFILKFYNTFPLGNSKQATEPYYHTCRNPPNIPMKEVLHERRREKEGAITSLTKAESLITNEWKDILRPVVTGSNWHIFSQLPLNENGNNSTNIFGLMAKISSLLHPRGRAKWDLNRLLSVIPWLWKTHMLCSGIKYFQSCSQSHLPPAHSLREGFFFRVMIVSGYHVMVSTAAWWLLAHSQCFL